ncbi:MAG TPA: sugar ABC transporter permease [Candidatus Limnocylindrales bacterium]|nr:sugar ABC transporter permease [Candidatus Limnocylindrales bacterium]
MTLRARTRLRRGDRGSRFLVPAVVILGLTSIYPTLYSIYMSFFDWNWGLRFNFVGLANYVELATSERFRTALWNTIVFTVSAVSVEFVLGLGLALVMTRVRVGQGMLRTLLLVPLMVSGIIVSVIWKVMLDPTLGVLSYGLQLLGLPRLGFLGDPAMAMGTIVLLDTWWQTAFVFIVLSAAVQALPVEPFEAAEMDGANSWQRFRFLTLPLLKPAILVVLMFRTVDCLKVFAIIYGTTGGGPLTTTESVQILAYRQAFKALDMSGSMTTMVVFSAFALLVLAFYQRLLPSEGEAT